MLERYALFFAQAFGDMMEAKGLCGFSDIQRKLTGEPIDEGRLRGLVEHAAYRVRQACVWADMQDVLPTIDRLERGIYGADGVPPKPIDAVAQEALLLMSRLKDDLQNEFFFHIDQRDVPLYLASQPFGEAVCKRFPNATEDIAEAAKCLALQRSTAAVFHLMRVMELALRALAKKLNVTTIDPSVESWNKITDHVNKAITALPGKTLLEQKKKANFGAISAHLNSVRIAWRNEVMHPKQSYSREEAHTIFAAVRAFMIDLATW